MRRLGPALLAAAALGAMLAASFVGSPPQPPPPAASFFADGALVLAREHGALALALAAKPREGRLALQATVLGPQGGLRSGLDVAFAARAPDGQVQRVRGRACGRGCYSAVADLRRALRVEVSLGGGGLPRSSAMFELPSAWPPRAALALVRRAEREWLRVRSVVTHERLASDPQHAVTTLYEAERPHRLAFHVRAGGETIIIGRRRWDRDPGGPWVRSADFPEPVRAVAPYWTPDVHDATLLRTETVRGRPAYVVSFVNPRVPQWFTVWIDRRTFRTLQLDMTARAHFMHHVYTDFDSPLDIQPPQDGRGVRAPQASGR